MVSPVSMLIAKVRLLFLIRSIVVATLFDLESQPSIFAMESTKRNRYCSSTTCDDLSDSEALLGLHAKNVHCLPPNRVRVQALLYPPLNTHLSRLGH